MNNSTHISPNGSPSCPSGVSVFFTTAMAVITLGGFIGNILVIVAVYKTPSLRTSANYYYVNMAVSDFLSSLTTWPLYLTNEIITSSGSLIQGPLATVGCKVGVFFRVVSMTVSILSLVLIAVDRFVAIVYPLKATLITRKKRGALLLTTWFVSIAYCVPMGYYFRAENVGQETYCKFAWNRFALMIYYITGLVFFQLLPLLAIIILYSRIMSALRQRSSAEYTARCGNNQQNRYKQTQNFMKIFRSIVVVLFTWFSLFALYLILKIISPELFIRDRCKWILGFAYFVIPSLGIAINPVILFTYSTNFYQALRRLWPLSFALSKSCGKMKSTSRRPKHIQLHLREI